MTTWINLFMIFIFYLNTSKILVCAAITKLRNDEERSRIHVGFVLSMEKNPSTFEREMVAVPCTVICVRFLMYNT